LVAPLAGFLDQNIDPALRGIHLVEHQSSKANSSSDDDSKDEDEDKGDDNDNDNDKETSHQQIGWGGVGGRCTEHPGNVSATPLQDQSPSSFRRFY
jgi:hypothetical protein